MSISNSSPVANSNPAARLNPLAGKPAPASLLTNIPQLLTDYFSLRPDANIPAQQVSFGTSGHRGSAFDRAFNEWHVLAISQAICEYRKSKGIDGPLFLGSIPMRSRRPRKRARSRCSRRTVLR